MMGDCKGWVPLSQCRHGCRPFPSSASPRRALPRR